MSRQAAAHPLPTLDQEAFAEKIRRALYASKLCSYAQGFELLHQASQHYHWDLDLGGIALLFRGAASSAPPSWTGWRRPTAPVPPWKTCCFPAISRRSWPSISRTGRDVVATAAQCGVAVPAFSASLSYYDGCATPQAR